MSRRLDRRTCEETFRRLDDYLDRELTPEEMRLIEGHLRECAACSREFVFEAGIIQAVRGKLGRLDAPPALLDRISREISRVGQQDGETEPGAIGPE